MAAGDKKASQFTPIASLQAADGFIVLDDSASEVGTATGTVVLAFLGASLDMSTIASGGALPVLYGGTGVTTKTGTGNVVLSTSPTLVTPALGTPASGVLTNATGYPGDSSLVTTGALNSGSITSGFGNIDNGASTITTTGDITGGGIHVTGDTAAGDNAALGYTATEGLILTGQGSTDDVTIKNDADGTVAHVPTGTTHMIFDGDVGFGPGITSPVDHVQIKHLESSSNNGRLHLGHDTVGGYVGYTQSGSGRVFLGNLNDSGGTANLITLGYGAVTSGVPARPRLQVDQAGNTLLTGATAPSGGGASLVFNQTSDPTGIASNTSGIFAKDNGGTCTMYKYNESGTVSIMGPHDASTGEWIHDEYNMYSGEKKLYRMERIVRFLAGKYPEIAEFIEDSVIPEDERQDWDKNQDEWEQRRNDEIEAAKAHNASIPELEKQRDQIAKVIANARARRREIARAEAANARREEKLERRQAREELKERRKARRKEIRQAERANERLRKIVASEEESDVPDLIPVPEDIELPPEVDVPDEVPVPEAVHEPKPVRVPDPIAIPDPYVRKPKPDWLK